jgi:hypothetical protein
LKKFQYGTLAGGCFGSLSKDMDKLLIALEMAADVKFWNLLSLSRDRTIFGNHTILDLILNGKFINRTYLCNGSIVHFLPLLLQSKKTAL